MVILSNMRLITAFLLFTAIISAIYGQVSESVPVSVKLAREQDNQIVNCTAKSSPADSSAGEEDTVVQYQWLRDGVKVEGERFSGIDSYGLHIENPKVRDAGEYVCRWTTTFGPKDKRESKTNNITFSFESIPMIGRMLGQKRSEGDTVAIECNVYGWPINNIFWYRDGVQQAIVANATKYAISTSERGIVNGKLEIKNLALSDRGLYRCTAQNDYGTDNGEAMVRVKDKNAIIWPLIGIAIEIVVLAVVILACERRRLAKRAEEAEEHNAANSTINDSHKDNSDLRQRAVNA